MKRAYTELALRYHPDRQAEQSAAARERAEFHMREVNAAWEVLRSPARRAEYDTRLRGDTPVWEQAGARAKRTAPVSPRVTDLRPTRGAGAGHASASTGWRAGPVIAVLAVALVAALGFAAWATASSNHDDPDRVDVQTTTPFVAGGCVVLVSVDGRITPLVNQCSAVGAIRIHEMTDLGRPCPTPYEPFDVQADEVRLCLDTAGS